MTQTSKSLAAEAFEAAVEAILQAHRRHAVVLADGRLADAPRSRRALYNALKTYRRLETAFYHAATGENPATPDGAEDV
ncbi:MAG TPA: hypothetical protein VK558_17850 [Patescibacteria group bacterium]|nr:hypothetical protein [Patescibacteria group bacterium]